MTKWSTSTSVPYTCAPVYLLQALWELQTSLLQHKNTSYMLLRSTCSCTGFRWAKLSHCSTQRKTSWVPVCSLLSWASAGASLSWGCSWPKSPLLEFMPPNAEQSLIIIHRQHNKNRPETDTDTTYMLISTTQLRRFGSLAGTQQNTFTYSSSL